MSEMIRDRQASKKETRYDLFSSLLEANNEDSDEAKLSESELIGMSPRFCHLFCVKERNIRKYIHLPRRGT